MEQNAKHVGIILDGNGRWATQRGLARTAGHEEGVKTVVSIARAAEELGIEVLSLYAFSTENWKRSDEEVGAIMRLLIRFLNTYLDEFMQHKAQLRLMGDPGRLPLPTRLAVESAIQKTAKNDGVIMNIGLNYGGRDEILRAARRASADGIPATDWTEEMLSSYMDTGDLPPLDLLIRTGGEQRLSNFMLWQMAYTELYFTDTLWPDFSPEDLKKALDWYSQRNRRFGGVH